MRGLGYIVGGMVGWPLLLVGLGAWNLPILAAGVALLVYGFRPA